MRISASDIAAAGVPEPQLPETAGFTLEQPELSLWAPRLPPPEPSMQWPADTTSSEAEDRSPFADPMGQSEPARPRHAVDTGEGQSVLSSLGITAGVGGGGRRRAKEDSPAEPEPESQRDADTRPPRTGAFDDVGYLEPLRSDLPTPARQWETEASWESESARWESTQPPQWEATPARQEPEPPAAASFVAQWQSGVEGETSAPHRWEPATEQRSYQNPLPVQHSPIADPPPLPVPPPARPVESRPADGDDERTEPLRELPRSEPARNEPARTESPEDDRAPESKPAARTGRRRRSVQLADLLTEALMAYQTAQDANDAHNNPLSQDPSSGLPGPTSLPEPLTGSLGRDVATGDRPAPGTAGSGTAGPSTPGPATPGRDTRIGDSRWLTTRWDPTTDRP
jgi:hypothetical protein